MRKAIQAHKNWHENQQNEHTFDNYMILQEVQEILTVSNIRLKFKICCLWDYFYILKMLSKKFLSKPCLNSFSENHQTLS